MPINGFSKVSYALAVAQWGYHTMKWEHYYEVAKVKIKSFGKKTPGNSSLKLESRKI